MTSPEIPEPGTSQTRPRSWWARLTHAHKMGELEAEIQAERRIYMDKMYQIGAIAGRQQRESERDGAATLDRLRCVALGMIAGAVLLLALQWAGVMA